MKNIKQYFTYIEGIQKFFVLILLTFSIYQIAQITHFFTDFSSLFSSSNYIDLKEYEKPLFDDVDLKIDSMNEEENKIVLAQEDKPEIKLDTSDESKLSTILKIAGIIVCSATIVFGIYYALNYLTSSVDAIADVAQKGLDESNAATKEATKAALEALDKNDELLKEKQTNLIKEILKSSK